jgi:hypothetical protein
MGWWTVQCNDFTKKNIAASKALRHHQQSKGWHKEKDHRSGSGGSSEYLVGFTLFLNMLKFKASAVAM